MIVACTSCSAKYRYDEARFEGRPVKKIRCTKCDTIFEITNPDLTPKPELPPNPEPVMPNERTFIRRPESGSHESPEDSTKEYFLRKPKADPQVAMSQNLHLPAGKKLSIAAISGTDSGKTFVLDKPRVIIGRIGADIPLSDAEVSRAHAAVEVEDDQITLIDLGSTNGTYIGGERIDTASLDNYAEFEIGGTTLMLIITGL
jgi:predicted Zn finger-like uncharacterized protein